MKGFKVQEIEMWSEGDNAFDKAANLSEVVRWTNEAII